MKLKLGNRVDLSQGSHWISQWVGQSASLRASLLARIRENPRRHPEQQLWDRLTAGLGHIQQDNLKDSLDESLWERDQ